MPKNYIDLRIVLSYEKEYEDEDRSLQNAKVKVSRVKGLTASEVGDLVDHFGQMDRYQEMLSIDTLAAISDKADEMEDHEKLTRPV
jgi:hypothetical protein